MGSRERLPLTSPKHAPVDIGAARLHLTDTLAALDRPSPTPLPRLLDDLRLTPACRKWVAGEWRRCRWHNHPVRYNHGHTVRPHLRRRQTPTRSNQVVDVRQSGVGFLRLRPRGRALLHHNGYVRKPADVAGDFRDYLCVAFDRLRRARLRRPGPSDAPEANQGPVSTSEKLLSIVTCIKAARWWAMIFVPVAMANLFFAAINRTPA